MRILISVCTNRGLQAKTMNSLMNLEGEFDVICPTEGYTIAENRNYAAFKACNGKYDYLLFIDDDMVFEPDLLLRLVKNNKDICGVAYHSRGGKGDFKESDIMAMAEIKEGKYINLEEDDSPEYKELFEVYAVGTGVMLIKTEVFLKTKQPWFEFTYHPTGQCKNGEDWNFCFKVKESGYKIHLDPTLKIGHLGDNII